MNNTPELVNRVAESGIITLNLEEFFPTEPIERFDLKNYLFMGLILKEKDFRAAMQALDWSQYTGKSICLFCSADAIIPLWAYQLVSILASPYAKRVVCGSFETLLTVHYHEVLGGLDLSVYRDKRIVVKGCGEKPVPASAYSEIARLLQPIAKSIMYGEACSAVPLFKRK